uniref:Putative ABC transporter n=1 Tax=Aplysina aerophoba bacterial symbiont clone AANRPS TaxID=1042317 RepID=F8S2Y7_9BACT|nr:putative ABC transporter [Aplysina aerophoba bacterial symbiont clone AANRPS]
MASPITMSWYCRMRMPSMRLVVVRIMPGSVRLGGPRPARCARGYCRARFGLPCSSVCRRQDRAGQRRTRWAVVCSVRAGSMSCSVRVACSSVRGCNGVPLGAPGQCTGSGGSRISMDAARRSTVALSTPSSVGPSRSSSGTGMRTSWCRRRNSARHTVLGPPGKSVSVNG